MAREEIKRRKKPACQLAQIWQIAIGPLSSEIVLVTLPVILLISIRYDTLTHTRITSSILATLCRPTLPLCIIDAVAALS